MTSLKSISPRHRLRRAIKGIPSRYVATKAAGIPVDREARIAVIGAGFAGLATAFHLVQEAKHRRIRLSLKVVDAHGIGAGASGASAGLLHPCSPKGSLLWNGTQGVSATMTLLRHAERHVEGAIAGRGILKPARDAKQEQGFFKVWGDGDRDLGVRPVSAADALRLLPGAGVSEDGPGALHVGSGAVLVPQRYMEGLWRACEHEAAEAGPGVTIELEIGRTIRSVWRDLADYDRVVVAAGAASTSIEECAGLPMQYCHGFTIEMAPGTGAQAYPDAAPSLLGPTYIARHGSHRAVVGATKTYGLSPADAAAAAGDGLGWHPTAVRPSLARAAVGDGGVESRVGSNEAGEEQGGARVPGVGDGKVGGAGGGAVAVVDEAEGTRVLEAAGRALWAPLEGWETVLVRGGVRGLPPRSPRGAVPLAGRVRGDEEGGQEVWVLAGLGSRGLVYHGLLGEMVARAVLEGSPDEIGPEFRAWQGGQIVS